MRSVTRILTCLLLAIGTIGCHKTVRLTVRNPTPEDLEVEVRTQTLGGVQQASIPLGRISKDRELKKEFDVSKKGGYTVSARLPGGPTVFSESKSVLGDRSPVENTIELKLSNAIRLQPGAEGTIRNAFSLLGRNNGFPPVEVSNGLKTVFGGLFVIAPPSENQPNQTVYFSLTPTQFSSEVEIDTFHYPENRETNTVFVTTANSASLSTDVPIYGKLAASFRAGTVYRVSWDMAGVGPVNKVEKDGWTYQSALNHLGRETRAQLCQALKKPNALMIYVNRLYVIKDSTFKTTEGTVLDVGAEAQGLTVIQGNVAYKFESSNEKEARYQTTLINADGVTWSDGDFSCTEVRRRTAPAPSPAPGAAPGSTPVGSGIVGGLMGTASATTTTGFSEASTGETELEVRLKSGPTGIAPLLAVPRIR